MEPTRVVSSKRTEMYIDDMMIVGASAYQDVFQEQVSTYVLATAAAQWTTECGIKPGTERLRDGTKVIYSIWNNNWGNITCKPDADCDKHWFITRERIKKGATEAEDVWKELKLYYKAYETPYSGAIDYWKKMRKNYPKSLKTFQSGDMKLVANTLSAERYYTDLVSKYQRNLEQYFPKYVSLLTTGREL